MHNNLQPREALSCFVCGGKQFSLREVLWEELISEWELSTEETGYMNRQQGLACARCASNLRSIVLAKAILDYCGSSGTLYEFVTSNELSRTLRLVELNPAGNLTFLLSRMPGHQLCSYPEYDLMDLALDDNFLDLIVHSDTIEHIPDPLQGLRECWRVLKPGGACCFTAPTVVGRMTRSRDGMKPSYHGKPGEGGDDLMVHTEFGADIWTYILRAGFQECRIINVEYPAGLAFMAIKHPSGA